MQRRQVLAHAAGTLALSSLAAPALAKPALAADFAAALPSQPLLAPFKGVDDRSGNVDCDALMLRGRWPEELRGRFYRNGPALYERGAERYHHWFDGDGMVQQFTIGSGRVSHKGRLVRTAKLQAEQKAGRFLMSTVGTTIEGGPPAGGPDAFNVANTNALEHGGRVLALWEGGSAYGLDPRDLSTQGPITWGEGLAQMPFSAHPKVDPSGHLWNFGTAGPAIVAWSINAQGALAKVQVGESPFPGGMVHDMAVTERYLVVPLPPISLNFSKPVPEGPRRFAMVKGEPLRVLVMDKADIRQRRVFELPPQVVFHVGNAHDAPGGEVVLSFVGAPDAWFLDRGAVAVMSGRTEGLGAATGTVSLQQVRLNMNTGRVQSQAFDGQAEFPRVHPQRVGLPSRYLLTAGTAAMPAPGAAAGRGALPLLHRVQVQDMASGRSKHFDYGAQVVAEEHVLVPKPGKSGELDAWLLGTTYDARRQSTVLNLLDAAHVEDGPIAQAVLPYTLPLGFHGNFTAA